MKKLLNAVAPELRKYVTALVVVLIPMLLMAATTMLDLTTSVKGILPSANGGTGMAYFAVTGPTTTRTYTFRDSNGTVMFTDTAVAASQLPNPAVASLGGVQSKDCTGTGHILKINTDGTVTCSADAAGPNYADNEVPTGTINGVNPTFTLAHTPSPTGSLKVFRNGQNLVSGAGNDYTLSGTTITFLTTAIPKTADAVIADYRW